MAKYLQVCALNVIFEKQKQRDPMTDYNSTEKRSILYQTEASQLATYGNSLIGKTAQSTILTQISKCGQKAEMMPAQKITGYSVQEWCGEPNLMICVGTEEVWEDSLRNIKE